MAKDTKPHEPTEAEVNALDKDNQQAIEDTERLFAKGEKPATAAQPARPAPSQEDAGAQSVAPPVARPTPESHPHLFDFAGNRL